MAIERDDLLEVAKEALEGLGIKNYSNIQLTYIQKAGNGWRVSFTYTPFMGWSEKIGCFAVDIDTEEITFTALDRVWKS